MISYVIKYVSDHTETADVAVVLIYLLLMFLLKSFLLLFMFSQLLLQSFLLLHELLLRFLPGFFHLLEVHIFRLKPELEVMPLKLKCLL